MMVKDLFKQIPECLQVLLVSFLCPSNFKNIFSVYPEIIKDDKTCSQIMNIVLLHYYKIKKLYHVSLYNILCELFPDSMLFLIYSSLIHFNPRFALQPISTECSLLDLAQYSKYKKRRLPVQFHKYFHVPVSIPRYGMVFNNFQRFIHNLNIWFYYDKWSKFLTKDMFLAGDCIAQYMCGFEPLSNQDIDIFC